MSSQKEENENKVEEQQELAEKKDNQLAENEDEGNKSSRSEKKFKKAMLKMGMKPVAGINRVTIKKNKQMMLYIDNPDILQTPGQDNSYIVFGEAKLQDFPGNIAADEAGKFKAPEQAEEEKKEEKEEKKEESAEPLSEEGLDQETIQMVIDHCSCSRQDAVRVLHKHNGDSVNAILELAE